MKLFKEKPKVFCKDCNYFKDVLIRAPYVERQTQCHHPDNIYEDIHPVTGEVSIIQRSVVFYSWNKYLNCKRYKEKEIG